MACRYTYQGKTYEAHEFDDVLRAMPPSVAEKYMDGVKSIPSAPMIGDTKSWVALGLKRAIMYAVQHGMTRVAWANGEQNAGHYDLSKQVSRITYEGTYLRAFDHSHKEVIGKSINKRLVTNQMRRIHEWCRIALRSLLANIHKVCKVRYTRGALK